MRFLILLLLPGSPAFVQVLDGDVSEHPASANDRADGSLLELRAHAWADGLWIGMEFEDIVDADSGSGLVLHQVRCQVRCGVRWCRSVADLSQE